MNNLEIEKLLSKTYSILERHKTLEREAKKMKAEIKELLAEKKTRRLSVGSYTAEIAKIPRTRIDAKKAKRFLSAAILKKLQTTSIAECISITKVVEVKRRAA